jgi:signal transduction histidine kinase
MARGVYPALLTDAGLAEALRAAALRAPVAAEVHSDGVGRYAPEVESAVYFCCLEALQNAAKHARDATRVTISLEQGDGLRFEVRDDGPGFDPGTAARGAGLTNMRDRIGALGGEVTVASEPGRGVVVRGSVPVELAP